MEWKFFKVVRFSTQILALCSLPFSFKFPNTLTISIKIPAAWTCFSSLFSQAKTTKRSKTKLNSKFVSLHHRNWLSRKFQLLQEYPVLVILSLHPQYQNTFSLCWPCSLAFSTSSSTLKILNRLDSSNSVYPSNFPRMVRLQTSALNKKIIYVYIYKYICILIVVHRTRFPRILTQTFFQHHWNWFLKAEFYHSLKKLELTFVADSGCDVTKWDGLIWMSLSKHV